MFFSIDNDDCDPIVNYILPCTFYDDNIDLLAHFSIVELTNALFQMESNKSLGLDGLNPIFYKKKLEPFKPWNFFYRHCLARKWKFPLSDKFHYHCPNPKNMKDYHPISLYNVLYKIISQALTNHPKPLLKKCISLEQSTFVEWRSILDDVPIASDVIHPMRCKTKGRIGEMALKIDISKDFDKVHWNYLFKVMAQMGFHQKWISWMKLCRETTHYSMMVNGDSIEHISIWRELMQGDPLSPYIFIICTKGLYYLLKEAE